MSKTKTSYACTECGHRPAKWVGQCPACKAWNSIEESAPQAAKSVGLKTAAAATGVSKPAVRVADVAASRARYTTTGIGELDRVLGGGTVAGSVILLAGEPGAGKSTLLMEVASKAASQDRRVLYVSGEESVEQIKVRADRIGAGASQVLLAAESDLGAILSHIEQCEPDLMIVDSVQTIAAGDVTGRIGSVSQVVECSSALTRVNKARGSVLVLVGQVTKADEIAGPKTLEHLVDIVTYLEGDKRSTMRLLRGIKNRYGAADEIGCFVHTQNGLEEVPDPSGLFLGERSEPVAGTCVTVTVEGKRPLVAEVQALVAPTPLPVPRRGSSGLDSARLAMTQAVVERHGKVRLHDRDVYCGSVGGIRIVEPCADLALALAIASAANETPLAMDLVALGEVALSGDIRPVHDIDRRLGEAGRMGFKKALVPLGTVDRLNGRASGGGANGPVRAFGVTLIEVDSVGRAVQAIAQMPSARAD